MKLKEIKRRNLISFGDGGNLEKKLASLLHPSVEIFKRLYLEDGKINEFVGLETEHIFMDYEDWQKGRRGDPMLKNRFSRELAKLDVGFEVRPRKKVEGQSVAVWGFNIPEGEDKL